MNLSTARVLLTGAGGGIGGAIASELLAKGAMVLLVDINETALRRCVEGELQFYADRVEIYTANLTSADDRARLAEFARYISSSISAYFERSD